MLVVLAHSRRTTEGTRLVEVNLSKVLDAVGGSSEQPMRSQVQAKGVTGTVTMSSACV